MKYFYLSLIFILALYLRNENLGGHGFWIDECLYIGMIDHPSTQELVPSLIGKLSNTDSEFSVRLPFAIAGSLTVLALYWVIEDKKMALLIALFFAVCPLFVWWDRMARPYAFAGLFMVLSWKHPIAMIGAVLCTPISILGLNLTKIKEHWQIFFDLVVFVVIIYFLREDHARGHWNIQTILSSSRWFYLPALAGLLYLGHLSEFLSKLQYIPKKSVRRMPALELAGSGKG